VTRLAKKDIPEGSFSASSFILGSSPRSRYFHAIQPKSALSAAGLTIGDDVGLLAALFNGKRCDPARTTKNS